MTLALLALAVLTSGASPKALEAPDTNVLVILADDIGIDQVGCYTPSVTWTPTIDGLATRGVRFLQAWSSPICSPTRAELHTGRFAFQVDR